MIKNKKVKLIFDIFGLVVSLGLVVLSASYIIKEFMKVDTDLIMFLGNTFFLMLFTFYAVHFRLRIVRHLRNKYQRQDGKK